MRAACVILHNFGTCNGFVVWHRLESNILQLPISTVQFGDVHMLLVTVEPREQVQRLM